MDCESQAYRLMHNSKCKHHCRQCKRFGQNFPCKNDGTKLQCFDCGLNFLNVDCYNYHKKEPNSSKSASICRSIYLCVCGRIRNRYFSHNCADIPSTQSQSNFSTNDMSIDDLMECKKCQTQHDPNFPNICYIPKFEQKGKYIY